MLRNVCDSIKPILALVITTGAFSYFFLVTFTDRKPDPQIITAIVFLSGIPASYYFGSSSGAAKKDQTIQDLTKNNNSFVSDELALLKLNNVKNLSELEITWSNLTLEEKSLPSVLALKQNLENLLNNNQ